MRDTDVVYNLAADMGGVGFIENNKALSMLSVLINTHLLEAAREFGIERYFFASVACADARDGEKQFSERLCLQFAQDFALTTRIARLHNIYGSWSTYEGGRENAPAAICRKVAEAVMTGRREIAIWGDGDQTRSFTYIDDCVEGIQRILFGEITEPLDLGSSETVSINQLVDIVEDIAGVKLKRSHDLSAPTGVRTRDSDNTRIQELLGWQPSISLRDGLEETYRWIHDEMSQHRYARAA